MQSMNNDLAYALDQVLWAKEELGFKPDPWQAELLRSNSKRLLLNCSRQSGKSTATAILALHTAIFKPESLILMVSPSLRQSLELFRKLTDNLDKLAPKPALAEFNKLSCNFENGSRVVALPGHEGTIRCFSAVSLIIEDEAAWVDDAIYIAIRPMLAVSNGRLVLMSTPHGQRGHFYDAWTAGGDTWRRIQITADQCPRISKEFLDEEKRSLGDWLYRQEYHGEFVANDSQLFDISLIDSMLDSNIMPLFYHDLKKLEH
jgi:hypothetical protein